MRKRICVISLALPIETDPRTGRQVLYLSRDYDITLISHGKPDPAWQNVTWRPVNMHRSNLRKLYEIILLFIGRFLPSVYDFYYWNRPRYRQTLAYALESNADAYHASDWAAIPIAVEVARKTGAPVVFDADEYWPLERESSRRWQWFFSPLIVHNLRRYAASVSRTITVSDPIAERYEQEFGLKSIVVYNSPDSIPLPEARPVQPPIRLIHHGAAVRNRLLETMIEAVPLLDARFTLDMLLVDHGNGYVDDLQRLAERVAPGRVFFRPEVGPMEVVAAIADCDIEMCFIVPKTFTYEMTLPNKLFEAVVGGLAVFSGPSPAMAAVIRQYDVGWVSDGFTAQDIADRLNKVTVEEVMRKKQNARVAASQLNAEVELNKVVALYHDMFGNEVDA